MASSSDQAPCNTPAVRPKGLPEPTAIREHFCTHAADNLNEAYDLFLQQYQGQAEDVCRRLLQCPSLGTFHKAGCHYVLAHGTDEYIHHAEEAVRLHRTAILAGPEEAWPLSPAIHNTIMEARRDTRLEASFVLAWARSDQARLQAQIKMELQSHMDQHSVVRLQNNNNNNNNNDTTTTNNDTTNNSSIPNPNPNPADHTSANASLASAFRAGFLSGHKFRHLTFKEYRFSIDQALSLAGTSWSSWSSVLLQMAPDLHAAFEGRDVRAAEKERWDEDRSEREREAMERIRARNNGILPSMEEMLSGILDGGSVERRGECAVDLATDIKTAKQGVGAVQGSTTVPGDTVEGSSVQWSSVEASTSAHETNVQGSSGNPGSAVQVSTSRRKRARRRGRQAIGALGE